MKDKNIYGLYGRKIKEMRLEHGGQTALIG